MLLWVQLAVEGAQGTLCEDGWQVTEGQCMAGSRLWGSNAWLAIRYGEGNEQLAVGYGEEMNGWAGYVWVPFG